MSKKVKVFCVAEAIGGRYRDIAMVSRKKGTQFNFKLPGGAIRKGEGLHEGLIRLARQKGYLFHNLEKAPFYSDRKGDSKRYFFYARYCIARGHYEKQEKCFQTSVGVETLALIYGEKIIEMYLNIRFNKGLNL